jgi:hypothetical protein
MPHRDLAHPRIERRRLAKPPERAQDIKRDILRDVSRVLTVAQHGHRDPHRDLHRPARGVLSFVHLCS